MSENNLPPVKEGKPSPPYIPSQQEFLGEFNKFPRGEPSVSYEMVRYAILSYKTFSGDPVSWQLIKDKWNEYLNVCKAEKTPERFMVGMKSFIEKRKFNENFVPAVKSWMKNL